MTRLEEIKDKYKDGLRIYGTGKPIETLGVEAVVEMLNNIQWLISQLERTCDKWEDVVDLSSKLSVALVENERLRTKNKLLREVVIAADEHQDDKYTYDASGELSYECWNKHKYNTAKLIETILKAREAGALEEDK